MGVYPKGRIYLKNCTYERRFREAPSCHFPPWAQSKYPLASLFLAKCYFIYSSYYMYNFLLYSNSLDKVVISDLPIREFD